MRGMAAICVVLLAASPVGAAEPAPDPTQISGIGACELERGTQRAVARIVDGETVLLDDGSHLRLVGALAPRAMDVGAEPGEWPPEQATIDALRNLVMGRSLQLWLDRERMDRYGQVLAHAVVSVTGSLLWVQGALVERGFARAYAMPGNDACIAPLIQREQQARDKRVGLWANAAYVPREAGSRSGLARYTGTFQIVSGTVRSVSGRSSIYLGLEPRGRPGQPYGFSVLIANRRAAFPDERAPRSLKGQRVRVRGWIEQRRGLLIAIDSAGHLELLE